MEDPLAPFIKALSEHLDARDPSEVSAMDQFKSLTGDKAKELLAYYVLTCMHQEQGEKDQTSRYSLKFAFKIKQLAPVEVMGVILSLAELISDFLLDQSDGTYQDVVNRLLDPDIPLIPGRNETLRELEKQFNTEGPSGG